MSTGAVERLYEQFEPHERFTLTLQALARGDEAEADRLSGSCPRKQYSMRDAAFGERVDTAFDIMAIACIDLRCLWGKLCTLEWAIGGARLMATHHHITATIALMEGERLGKGLSQLDFFQRRPDLPEEDQEDDDDDAVEVEDHALEAPQPLRASEYREGELARRMAAVEDRMQVMTDYTFASLVTAANQITTQLAEVWAGFDRFCHNRLGVSAETLLSAWDFPTGGEVAEVLNRYAHVKPDPAKVDEYAGIYCRAWDRRFGEED